MRLTTSAIKSGLNAAMTRGRSVVSDRAGSNLKAVASVRSRFEEEVRRRPQLAALIGAITGTWTKLVESFATMIDPYIARFFPDTRLVALMTAAGDVELHRIFQGAITPIGPLAKIDASEKAELGKAKWTAIELRLRADQLLQRTLTLPAASRDFLGPIIEHRLDRLTPWRPERVLYGYQVLDGAEAAGGVGVMFTATSKDFLTAPLRDLAEAGLSPTSIGPEEALSEPLRLNLMRDAPKGRRTDSRRTISRVALIVFFVLTLAYVASASWASGAGEQQREAVARLTKARRLLKTASMGAVGDRERLLLEAKQPEKSMVVLANKLAEAIPDDTYLKEFAVTSDKVRLAGTSGNAPALIGRLEAIGLVNVRFASALTRGKNQKDNFEVTADRAAPAEAGPR